MSTDDMPIVLKENDTDYGKKVGVLRKERKMTQQQLATRVGASLSWVSQVENSKIEPSKSKQALLARILGPELIAITDSNSPDGLPAQNQESVLHALLWSGRIAVLNGLGHLHANAQSGRRLHQLARILETTAEAQPIISDFSNDQSSLLPVYKICQRTTTTLEQRLCAFTELSYTKLDYPYNTRYKNTHLVQTLKKLADDFGIEQQAFVELEKQVLNKITNTPNWETLHCIGGALGTLKARQESGPGIDFNVLAGADPIGWLGLDYISGRWLVPFLNKEQEGIGGQLELSGNETNFFNQIAKIGGLAFLGSPGLIWSENTNYLTESDNVDSEFIKSESNQTTEISKYISIALGRYWTRIECKKIEAFYTLNESHHEELDEIGRQIMPPTEIALTSLESLSNSLEISIEEEKDFSGIGITTENWLLATLTSINKDVKNTMAFLSRLKH